MESLFYSAIAFSLSQVSLSLLLLLRGRTSWSTQEKILFAFLIAVLAYLVFPFVTAPWVSMLAMFVQTFVPGLFWLFSASLFDDRFRISGWPITLVLMSAVIPLIGQLLTDFGLSPSPFLFRTLPQTLEFVFLGFTLLVIVRFWRVDLVESRRDLRFWFCAITGFYILTLLLLREVFYPGEAWLKTWEYVPLGAICMLTNILLLQYKPGLLHHESSSPKLTAEASHSSQPLADTVLSPEVTDISQQLLDELNSLMQDDHIYREMGLTIGKLADQLDLPEYRLRKIINAGLGYRNFNDFLNGYRIKEAGAHLANPDLADQTVLNIALDTGFRSLSSFNKAFKEAFQLTPSEYRNSFKHPITEKPVT